MSGMRERLDLADWRRQVSGLYAEVRKTAMTDPEAAWDRWRAVREELFRTHPQSPVPVADRATFRAQHWRYNAALRFEASEIEREPSRTDVEPGRDALGAPPSFGTLALPISTGGEQAFSRIGFVEVPFPAGARRLGLYWMAGYAGGLFLPFRDATNGQESYAAGRYLLDTAKSADLGGDSQAGTLVLDFNFAFQPSCAFDPSWPCPLAPPENRLDIRVEAGERLA